MKCFLTTTFLITSILLYSQNLDKLKSGKKVEVSGGVNFNTNYTSNFQNQHARLPLGWSINANLNVKILDFSLPFTVTYSNLGLNYTQPFNITSINPKYKCFQAFIGLTSLPISKNTLSGRIFLGGGVEIKLKKFNIKAMFGRLNKAVSPSISENQNQFSYKRLGGAVHFQYQDKGQSIAISVFKAKDFKNSINSLPLNTTITPKDNFVFEIEAKSRLWKILDLTINYAGSWITDNLNIPKIETEANKMDFVLEKNISSSFNNSIDASASLNFKQISFGINYQRVDPNFQSLGIYFINNDLENINADIKFRVFKNRLNISLKGGLQRNNIRSESKKVFNRINLSLSANARISKTTTINLNYNNFNNYTISKDLSDPFQNGEFDSLKLYNLSQSANLNLNQIIKNKNLPQNISLNITYNQTGQIQGNIDYPGFFGGKAISVGNSNHFTSTIISYSLNQKNKRLGFQFSLNHNLTLNKNQTSYFTGPNFSITKKFKNKTGSITGKISYNFNKNPLNSINLINYSLQTTYTPKFKNEKSGKMSFRFSASYLQGFSEGMIPNHQVSVRVGVGYSI